MATSPRPRCDVLVCVRAVQISQRFCLDVGGDCVLQLSLDKFVLPGASPLSVLHPGDVLAVASAPKLPLPLPLPLLMMVGGGPPTPYLPTCLPVDLPACRPACPPARRLAAGGQDLGSPHERGGRRWELLFPGGHSQSDNI